MNSSKLKSIISKKAKGNSNLSTQLLQMFFFERIIERISVSNYKNNFIIKGGFLLSSIFGDDERTTKDIDAVIKNIPLEKGYLNKIIDEILNINLGDNIDFTIVSIKEILEESLYGGFNINILARMDQVKVYISIELSTGDIITPREIKYKYKSIFENKQIPILAYTAETILSEKFHCIITRGIFNTRMKDFYDIYKLTTKEMLNRENLIQSIKNTFHYRNTKLDIIQFKNTISKLKCNEKMKNMWERYQDNSPYATEINYNELFIPLTSIVELLENNI